MGKIEVSGISWIAGIEVKKGLGSALSCYDVSNKWQILQKCPNVINSLGSRGLVADFVLLFMHPVFLDSIYPWLPKKVGCQAEKWWHFLVQPKIQDGRQARRWIF